MRTLNRGQVPVDKRKVLEDLLEASGIRQRMDNLPSIVRGEFEDSIAQIIPRGYQETHISMDGQEAYRGICEIRGDL